MEGAMGDRPGGRGGGKKIQNTVVADGAVGIEVVYEFASEPRYGSVNVLGWKSITS